MGDIPYPVQKREVQKRREKLHHGCRGWTLVAGFASCNTVVFEAGSVQRVLRFSRDRKKQLTATISLIGPVSHVSSVARDFDNIL